MSGAKSFGEALRLGVPVVLISGTSTETHPKPGFPPIKKVQIPIEVLSPPGKEAEIIDTMVKMGIITVKHPSTT